ncbi:MAG: hypothetical protein V1925_03535 [Candidatus Omnitrophota bacterium]
MKELTGLATGIGSLPYKEAKTAVELVLKYCPHIPFWPQLPRHDVREGMVAQFCENMPCIKLTNQGAVFDPQDKERELEKFYEAVINDNTDYFKITGGYASGLYVFYQALEKLGLSTVKAIKCHITGPFTFAATFKDENNRSLLHDKVFMQAFTKGLAMKGLWQIKLFEKFGKKIIVFLDEPYLACFGSAYTPINREDVLSGLKEVSGALKAQGALVGVHCCGNTDWSVFTDTQTINIINFDAFGFLDKLLLYADNLKEFFSRGGMLCWGIVPTQEFIPGMKAEFLVDKINAGIDALVKKGIDRKVICDSLILSPACGLGAMEEARAEQILKLLSEVSAKIKK